MHVCKCASSNCIEGNPGNRYSFDFCLSFNSGQWALDQQVFRLHNLISKVTFKVTFLTFFPHLAETAEKVTAAISAPQNSEMKLEDLEAHLNALKQMFIDKQKMMEGIEKKDEAKP